MFAAVIVMWENTDFWGREGGRCNLAWQPAGPSVLHPLNMVCRFTLAPIALMWLAAVRGAGSDCQMRAEKIIKGPEYLYMRS